MPNSRSDRVGDPVKVRSPPEIERARYIAVHPPICRRGLKCPAKLAGASSPARDARRLVAAAREDPHHLAHIVGVVTVGWLVEVARQARDRVAEPALGPAAAPGRGRDRGPSARRPRAGPPRPAPPASRARQGAQSGGCAGPGSGSPASRPAGACRSGTAHRRRPLAGSAPGSRRAAAADHRRRGPWDSAAGRDDEWPGSPMPQPPPIRSATSISTIARLIGSPTRRQATRSSGELRGSWNSARRSVRGSPVAMEHVVEPVGRDLLRVADVEPDPRPLRERVEDWEVGAGSTSGRPSPRRSSARRSGQAAVLRQRDDAGESRQGRRWGVAASYGTRALVRRSQLGRPVFRRGRGMLRNP